MAEQITKLGLGSAPAEPEWLLSELATLPEGALPLFQALERATSSASPLSGMPLPHTTPWMALPPVRRQARQAYATLLTTADDAYLAGAITLGSSIRAFDTVRELLALVTAAVPVAWHEELRGAGFEVLVVDELQEFWWGQHARCKSYHSDQDARWGHESTKLRLWQLEQYETLLYIDADALLLGPADDLFRLDGFAAERGLSGSWFNAGVMLVQPSQPTFDALVARGAGKPCPPQDQGRAQPQPQPQPRQACQLAHPPRPGEPPNIFGNVVDCTEQALLNAYFDGSEAGRSVQHFDVAHPHDPEHAAGAAVAHWITLQCPKAWDHQPGRMIGATLPLPVECSVPLYSYWWRVYNRTGADVLGQAPETRRTVARKLGNEYAPRCSPRCPNDFVNDGMCDHGCDNEECEFDHGDCWRKHAVSPPPPMPHPPPLPQPPRPPPQPPHAPRSPCECTQRSHEPTRDTRASRCYSQPANTSEEVSLPVDQCGCYSDHGHQVCYTVGQCGDDDSHESFASHRYKGVYWRECKPMVDVEWVVTYLAEMRARSPTIHSTHQPQPPSPPPYSTPQAESPSADVWPKECAESSIGDKVCNVECYRASCEWDGGDCDSPGRKETWNQDNVPAQCADGCPPNLIKDGSCDEACNVEACLFDGNKLTLLPTSDPHHVSGDCDHGHDECYNEPDGTDYRGTVSETEDGDACLVWDHKTGLKWARDLGGHNYCRNPEVLNSDEPPVKEPRGERPWCFRADEFARNDDKRWGYCDVQEASKAKDAHGEPCPGVYRAKANHVAEAISNALEKLNEKGLDEVSNEAAAAPLISLVLSITFVLLIGSLVFTRRMMKVWHAPNP